MLPVRAVVKQASIAFPPFFRASVPACTASALLVPATKPFPSLKANGFGRRCEDWSDRVSSLSKSLGNHVLGENETLSGGRKANALNAYPTRRSPTEVRSFMFERCAPLKTQRIVAKHVKDLFGFIPEIGNLIGFIVPLSCTYFHPENRNLIAPECDTFENEKRNSIFLMRYFPGLRAHARKRG